MTSVCERIESGEDEKKKKKKEKKE